MLGRQSNGKVTHHRLLMVMMMMMLMIMMAMHTEPLEIWQVADDDDDE